MPDRLANTGLHTARGARWQSLRVRLPLLVSGAVAITFALFLWTTRQALEQTMEAAGAHRAFVAAEQVTSLLAQSAARGLAEARRVSSDKRIREFLLNGKGNGDDAAVRTTLTPLAAPNQSAVELWDRNGVLALAVAGKGPEVHAAPSAQPHATVSGLGRFRRHDNLVTYELVADVNTDPPAAADQRLGQIVVRRTLAAAQTVETVRRLVGDGAAVLLGNQQDEVWTDLAGPVAPPRVDATRDGVSKYRDAEGTVWIGALKLIPATPWAVWIGFPKDVVLAPATTVFRRMVAVAAVLVVLAAIAIAVLSGRLTRPLRELTEASEAVAAGEFDRRVRADRGDEIGRLGAAFNAMVDHVADAQRTLEQRVAERTKGLQRVNDELEAFSYSVSHDLRAPLRHVIGFSSLLQESAQPLGPQEQRYIATIVGAAKRMAQLIDDLLAFSRISRTTLNLSVVDLNAILREAQREADSQPQTALVGWTFDDLPAVHGDRALLYLVMVNLLSNAVKYSSHEPTPAIHVGTSREADEVIVFVRDNGVGFDMRYAQKLFGVFQRLHRQEEFEGTGIGLANVRRIIERHGGRTWAEGVRGEGATFYFSLPDAVQAGAPRDN